MALEVEKHRLVPKHSKVSESEKAKFLEQNNLGLHSLPKIMATDAAIKKLNLKADELVKIERISVTAGTSNYYRVVCDD